MVHSYSHGACDNINPLPYVKSLNIPRDPFILSSMDVPCVRSVDILCGTLYLFPTLFV